MDTVESFADTTLGSLLRIEIQRRLDLQRQKMTEFESTLQEPNNDPTQTMKDLEKCLARIGAYKQELAKLAIIPTPLEYACIFVWRNLLDFIVFAWKVYNFYKVVIGLFNNSSISQISNSFVSMSTQWDKIESDLHLFEMRRTLFTD